MFVVVAVAMFVRASVVHRSSGVSLDSGDGRQFSSSDMTDLDVFSRGHRHMARGQQTRIAGMYLTRINND